MGTNDKNSSPFDLNDDNSSQSLEDIIAEDNKAKSDEDAIINKDRRKDLTKKTSIIGGSVLAVCLIAGSLFFINPFGGDQNVGENDKKMTSIDDKRTTKIDNAGEDDVVTDDEFYREKGKYFPTKVEKWQEEPHNEQNEKDLDKSITKKESTTSLGIDANTLPSESSGYTSDDSKAFLKDGNLNTDYSYWTYEVFTSESGEHIERLLNPTFGDWSRVQYSSYPGNKNLEFNKLKDMFTNDWVNKNKDKKYSEYVPIFADWEGNDYKMGDKLLSSGPRWYGEIEDSTSEFKFNDKTQQYVVDVKADVKFTAWSKDQSKLEKTGTLTLKFVSNEDDKNDSKYKVLIDNASLKVD